ncbi:MAG: hypothetical protein QG625_2697 [Cyanobacteriota bacterium erpe_2018_sw_39hr_WHONDRS-SW48-000098_B_bin.30]|jgi:hypothetical protein|nr:hypothetical protein [Cyanobacteriota bacterium erpe_2018_sw_39hr_WHONDRS-SW48-000098_B_bin.30]
MHKIVRFSWFLFIVLVTIFLNLGLNDAIEGAPVDSIFVPSENKSKLCKVEKDVETSPVQRKRWCQIAYAKRDLKAGTVMTEQDVGTKKILAFKETQGGLYDHKKAIGRRTLCDVSKDEELFSLMFEGLPFGHQRWQMVSTKELNAWTDENSSVVRRAKENASRIERMQENEDRRSKLIRN